MRYAYVHDVHRSTIDQFFIIIISCYIVFGCRRVRPILFNVANTYQGCVFQMVTAAILEISVGCTLVSDAAVMLPIKMALISFCTSWGGACVNLQINSYIADGKKPIKAVLFKLTHGVIAGVISFVFWSFS